MPRKKLKFLSLLLCFCLLFEQSGFAQVAGELDISRHLLSLRNSFFSDKFRPLHLRYLSYDTLNNNFKLLLDKGDFKNPRTQELENTSKELLNYFFVGISLPNDSFWVNLRPDSPDNIIDPYLAQTDVGRILLEADLQLKKDTAQFTSPETPEGKEYWDKLYKKAGEIFGTENITIPTLTRPWIVPGEIIIRETLDNAYVYKATLKVMLEQDYLSRPAFSDAKEGSRLLLTDSLAGQDERLKAINEYSSQLIRELIIPKLTKDVNNAKRYAPLRQVYYSLILAQWFKSRFYGKGGLYSWLIDRKNLNGLTSKAPWSKTTYFEEYKRSFKEGEYNIKEPVYTPFGQTIRSYMSGGIAIGEAVGAAINAGKLPIGNPRHLEPPSNSHNFGIEVKGGNVDNPSEIDIIIKEAASPIDFAAKEKPTESSNLSEPKKSASSPVSEKQPVASSPAQNEASEDNKPTRNFIKITSAGRKVTAAEAEYSADTLSYVMSNTSFNQPSVQIRYQKDFDKQFLSLLENSTDNAQTLKMLRAFLQYIIGNYYFWNLNQEQINPIRSIYKKIQNGIPTDGNYRNQLLREIKGVLTSLDAKKFKDIMEGMVRVAVLEFESQIKHFSDIRSAIRLISPFSLRLSINTPTPVSIDRERGIAELNIFLFLPYRHDRILLDRSLPKKQQEKLTAIHYSDELAYRSLQLELRRLIAEPVIGNMLKRSHLGLPQDMLVDIVLILLEDTELSTSYFRSKYLWQLGFYGANNYVTLLRQLAHLPTLDGKIERIYKYLDQNFGLLQRYNVSPGNTPSLEATKKFIIDNFGELKRIKDVYYQFREAQISTSLEATKKNVGDFDAFKHIKSNGQKEPPPAETVTVPQPAKYPRTIQQRLTPWRSWLGYAGAIAASMALAIGAMQFISQIDIGKPANERIAAVSKYTGPNVYRRATAEAGSTQLSIQSIVQPQYEGLNPLTHLPSSGPRVAGYGNTVVEVSGNLFTLSGGYEASEMLITGAHNAVGNGGYFTQEGQIKIVPEGNLTSEEVQVTITLAPMDQGSQVRLPIILNGQIVPDRFVDGKLSLDQGGVVTANEGTGPATITYRIQKWDQNGRIQAAQPITEWMRREFQDLPVEIKEELDRAKLLSAQERLNVVAKLLNHKFLYSANQRVRLLTGTWIRFLAEVLQKNQRFVSDCDVLSMFAFIFSRYLGLDTVFVIGFSNADGSQGINKNKAHGNLIVNIDSKWLIFETTAVVPKEPDLRDKDKLLLLGESNEIASQPVGPTPKPLRPSKHKVSEFKPSLSEGSKSESQLSDFGKGEIIYLPDKYSKLLFLEEFTDINPGDDLTHIAERYYGNGSVGIAKLIAEHNRISDTDKIYAGRSLNLPAQLIHIVKGGETLSGIARDYYLKEQELVRMNPGINFSTRRGIIIYPGDKIVVAERSLLSGFFSLPAENKGAPSAVSEKQSASSPVNLGLKEAIQRLDNIQINVNGGLFVIRIEKNNSRFKTRIVLSEVKNGKEIGYFEIDTEFSTIDGGYRGGFIRITDTEYEKRGFAKLILGKLNEVFPLGQKLVTEVAHEESLEGFKKNVAVDNIPIVQLFQSSGWELTDYGYYDRNGEYHDSGFGEVMKLDASNGDLGTVIVKFRPRNAQLLLPGFSAGSPSPGTSSAISEKQPAAGSPLDKSVSSSADSNEEPFQQYTNIAPEEVIGPLKGGKMLLDVGFGTGIHTVAAVEEGVVLQAIGVDVHSNNSRLAEDVKNFAGNLEAAGYFKKEADGYIADFIGKLKDAQEEPRPAKNVKFIVSSATNLQFPDGLFDRVIFFDTYKFIIGEENKQKAIEEILRVADKQRGIIHARPSAGAKEADIDKFIRDFEAVADRQSKYKLAWEKINLSYADKSVLFKLELNSQNLNNVLPPSSLTEPAISSPVATDTKGGIDLRALPIVTQTMPGNLIQGAPRRIGAAGVLPSAGGQSLLNLDAEWQQIENMTQAGLIPSNERIREYLQASCQSEDCSQRIDKVLSLFADILRLEEERVSSTEPALREILVLLESDKAAAELQVALSKIEVSPKEPQTIEQ